MATNKRALVLTSGNQQEITSGDTLDVSTMPIFYSNLLQYTGAGTSNTDLFTITAFTTANSSNAYTLTPGTAMTAYITGMVLFIKFNAANTGAATLNISALGAKSIVKGVSNALVSGDLSANDIYTLIYDGTNFQILELGSPTSSNVTTNSDGTNAAYTIVLTDGDNIILPAITANRTVTFPAVIDGKIIYIWNKNSAAFTWNINSTPAVKSAALATQASIVNQTYTSFIGSSASSSWVRLF